MADIKFIVQQIIRGNLQFTDEKDVIIVDVGCGNGDEVHRLKKSGYQVYGCDLTFKKGEHVSFLKENHDIRKISEQYRLPFDDAFADIVYTNQVIEHVENIDSFFAEVDRIMKPGGISVHCYPNINKLVEPHIKVPLASRIQTQTWIRAWNTLGLLNMPTAHWKGLGVERMVEYLHANTWYRSNKKLRSIAQQYFKEVWFDGDLLLRSINGYKKAKIFGAIPGGGRIFNAMWTSLLLTKKSVSKYSTGG